MKKETFQLIIHYLKQPLKLKYRKSNKELMIYPNRSIKRKHFKNKRSNDINSWMKQTALNIKSGLRIHESFIEEIAHDQMIAERELYKRQLDFFTEKYGKNKANKIMNNQKRLTNEILDKKMGIYV
jgi:hypothetical protein